MQAAYYGYSIVETRVWVNGVVEVNKHNETVNAVEKEISKVSDDVHSMSDSDIDTGMHEYDRARRNKDGDNMRW